MAPAGFPGRARRDRDRLGLAEEADSEDREGNARGRDRAEAIWARAWALLRR